MFKSKQSNLNVVILAAGKGQRMQTTLPKVLHRLAGVPMLERVVNTARSLNPTSIYVVYGNGGEHVRTEMAHLDVEWVEQNKTLGTGHAVLQVLPLLDDNAQVLVLYGDVPLISAKTLQSLLDGENKNGLGLVITEFENPTGFGRIIRNELGNIVAIVEEKDADKQQKQIKEINTGIMTTRCDLLKQWLPKLKNKTNAQREYYLTDIVAMAVSDGHPVGGIMAYCHEEVRGVNSLDQLVYLERYYQKEKAYDLLKQGVYVTDPNRFDLRGELIAGQDNSIDINVVMEGRVSIGSNCTIGPNVILRNAVLGDNVVIKANTIVEEATVANDCVIGPFARIRPGTTLKQNVKVGNFVEIKNSELGEGTKASHLSYLGDAEIGRGVNVGAGTITCNYDGVNKHQTTIHDEAFIGSNTEIIAPVVIGKKATIGAGSTITRDAPANTLTLSRAPQEMVENWQREQE